MLANLLHVAGINHIITVDLHASQMQGFFKCPVDNLTAQPLIARWIRHNVPNWKEAVCVSKNPGGTKRVTSLADTLKLNFGIVTTDKKRGTGNMSSSIIMRRLDGYQNDQDANVDMSKLHIDTDDVFYDQKPDAKPPSNGTHLQRPGPSRNESHARNAPVMPSPLRTATAHNSPTLSSLSSRPPIVTPAHSDLVDDDSEYTDERARDITHGRLVQGHIVSDDYPSPTVSAMSTSMVLERPDEDPLSISRDSSFFNPEPHALGGTHDAAATSDEEEESFKNPGLEQMITLVGDVRNRAVFIVDDMIDKAGSWIAAAEAVVKRGGAKKVYCVATHGLFGGDSLEELENCDCIDTILVTNSFPIPPEKTRDSTKLVVLDLSLLLAEAIRRNHHGESISQLYQFYD